MNKSTMTLNISPMLILILALVTGSNALAQKDPFVRMAKIKVDSSQLETYKLALKEGIETAVRVEPGVLTLYALCDKNKPTNITVFEVYVDMAAYRTHIETPHFKKYKSTTMNMIKSLELVDVIPIGLESKK